MTLPRNHLDRLVFRAAVQCTMDARVWFDQPKYRQMRLKSIKLNPTPSAVLR